MARPPKAPQPPALAELPSRQFYTLKEAATELNRLYGRTDIDENYILQLASSGKVLVHWMIPLKMDVFLIPESRGNINCFDEAANFLMQDAAIQTLSSAASFLEFKASEILGLCFLDNLRSNHFKFTNIWISSLNTKTFNFSINNIHHYQKGFYFVKQNDRKNCIKLKVLEGEAKKYVEHISRRSSKHPFWSGINYTDTYLSTEYRKQNEIYLSVKQSDVYVLGEEIELIKQGLFRTETQNQTSTLEEVNSLLTLERPVKQFQASKAASAIALLCLHKDIKIDNHSTIASQLLARLPESLTALIGSTSMIDMLREAKDLLDRIEQVQTAEKLVNKNHSNLD